MTHNPELSSTLAKLLYDFLDNTGFDALNKKYRMDYSESPRPLYFEKAVYELSSLYSMGFLSQRDTVIARLFMLGMTISTE